jgi:hypothetical protein
MSDYDVSALNFNAEGFLLVVSFFLETDTFASLAF